LLIFMNPSLPAPTRFQQTFSICEKYVDPTEPILTEASHGVHRARAVWTRATDVAASIEWPNLVEMQIFPASGVG
jgi:hypothetical protein